jgi:hypothetical protein
MSLRRVAKSSRALTKELLDVLEGAARKAARLDATVACERLDAHGLEYFMSVLGGGGGSSGALVEGGRALDFSQWVAEAEEEKRSRPIAAPRPAPATKRRRLVRAGAGGESSSSEDEAEEEEDDGDT